MKYTLIHKCQMFTLCPDIKDTGKEKWKTVYDDA